MAFQLLNRKRATLVHLEQRFQKSVMVRVGGDTLDYVHIQAFDGRGGPVDANSLFDADSIEPETQKSFQELGAGEGTFQDEGEESTTTRRRHRRRGGRGRTRKKSTAKVTEAESTNQVAPSPPKQPKVTRAKPSNQKGAPKKKIKHRAPKQPSKERSKPSVASQVAKVSRGYSNEVVTVEGSGTQK